MKFIVDNALSPQITYGLVEQGYDAVHVRDFDMAACADTEIFDFAEKEGRSIISADTDLVLYWRFDKQNFRHLYYFVALTNGHRLN